MEKHKLKIKLRQGAATDAELLLRSGEIVPRSGIYEVIHTTHAAEPDSEGMTLVAVRGDVVRPCGSCGDQVRLRLVYAAPHISEDGDFSHNHSATDN